MNKRRMLMIAGGLLFLFYHLAGSVLLYADDLSVFTQRVSIIYNGSSATLVQDAATGVTYSRNGANLIVTSSAPYVEFLLSGSSSAGSLIITSSYPFKLTLNQLELACTNNAAISLRTTNCVYVVTAANTTNTLTDGTVYVETASGAFYSTGPLVFSGTGSLIIRGRHTSRHGIYGANRIWICDGDISIQSAAKDGIHAAKSFRMDNGSVSVTATGGDAIDGDEGTVLINGGCITIHSTSNDTKGIKGSGTFIMNGGCVNMTVSGQQGKGLDSGCDMTINGGTLTFNMSGAVYLETVTNSGSVYVDPSYCTAITSDSNLTVNGGTVIITHDGLAGKGISVDGGIFIYGGVVDITTSGGCSAIYTNSSKTADLAASDCLKADGNLIIQGGAIKAAATGNAGDCLTAGGYAVIGAAGSTGPSIVLATRGQKVLVSGSGNSADYSNPKGFKAEGNVTINGGSLRVDTKNDGGEGLESKGHIVVNGGVIEITAYDDCLNASSNITVNGGSVYCYSTGNDGIDANGQLKFYGGVVVSSGTTAPEEGFDCDQNTFEIDGGLLIGTGGASSTPTSSSCAQRSVLYTGTGASGTVIQVRSSSSTLFAYKIPRTYSSTGGGPGGGSSGMVLLFSTPSLASATSYSIVTGCTVTAGTDFHGVYTNATLSGGGTAKSFTASSSSMVTTVQ